MTNPHICGQCDSMNRSCCTLRVEANEGLPAPISEMEIQRILDFLESHTKGNFMERKVNSTKFVQQMALLFPDRINEILLAFPSNETHFELKTIGDTCIFKETNGCVLPDDVRPHFCRIYPFWVFDDEPHIFQDSSCLALENCQTIPEVLLALGTQIQKIEQIHEQIYEEWGISRSVPREKRRMFF